MKTLRWLADTAAECSETEVIRGSCISALMDNSLDRMEQIWSGRLYPEGWADRPQWHKARTSFTGGGGGGTSIPSANCFTPCSPYITFPLSMHEWTEWTWFPPACLALFSSSKIISSMYTWVSTMPLCVCVFLNTDTYAYLYWWRYPMKLKIWQHMLTHC